MWGLEGGGVGVGETRDCWVIMKQQASSVQSYSSVFPRSLFFYIIIANVFLAFSVAVYVSMTCVAGKLCQWAWALLHGVASWTSC